MTDTIDQLLEQLGAAARAADADEAEALAAKLVGQLRDDLAANPPAFLKALERAASGFDRPRAAELCEELVRHLHGRFEPYPFDASKSLLGVLRRRRYFHLLTSVADALIQTGQDAPRIRRLYAQGLLDQGLLSAGTSVLLHLERDCVDRGDEAELREARGLLGRARKQAYVNAAAEGSPGPVLQASLRDAIQSYSDEFRRDPALLWHGINAVALIARARRDGVSLERRAEDPAALARVILEQVRAMADPQVWDLATAAEACLAIPDYARCLEWTVKYTGDDGADAFEFGSTLRQLEEVWRLDDSDPRQAKILGVLRAALLEKEGGHLELDAAAMSRDAAHQLESDAQFEQVLGVDRYKTFQWYRRGLDRAAAVAKIVDRNGNGHGSGFLLRGSDLGAAVTADWVLVTNSHVLSEDPAEQRGAPPSLPPHEVRVRFEASSRPTEEFEVDEVLFSSPRLELDCTVATLHGLVVPKDPIPIAKRLPLVGKNQRVYVIGHPKGGGLSFSIDDNLLLDREAPKVHYRAPTEGGSSGSPVFNQSWDLIALHHAGGMEVPKLNGQAGTYPANEGLAFQSILAALRGKLG